MNGRSFPRFRRIHFVGIGGSGMSGIAELLVNLGYAVSGSDLSDGAATGRLRGLGARIAIGHAAENSEGADVVVVSSAVPAHNPEVQRARELGVPVIPRAEMLAELMRLKYGVAVAGSHGKTTTTSMAAHVLAEGGLDPTVVLGGRLSSLGSNARLGRGDFVVCEADESDGSFLKLTPAIAVVTNIDAEHLEAYDQSIDRLCQAFLAFCNAVPFYGAAIVCLDDERLQDLLPRIERRVVTYGCSPQAELCMRDYRWVDGHAEYTAVLRGDELGRVRLRQPGRHVALDSLAALAVGLELSIPFATAAAALGSTEGVERRMTLRGEVGGVRVIDDYAHHPTEIVATLQAVREGFDTGRVIAIFQPHRYSRVAALSDEFSRSLHDADVVLACPIYPAGEQAIAGVTIEDLAEGMRRHGHRGVELVCSPSKAAARAAQIAAPGDVVITLGAGDVGRAAPALLDALRARSGARGGAAGRDASVSREELQRLASEVAETEGCAITLDEPLAPLLSMRVGGPVAALLRPRGVEQVAAVVRALTERSVPHRLLGGGSNLLADDRPLDFVVVHVGAATGSVAWTGRRVRVPAGLPLAALLREVNKKGLTGLEWAAGLPGTVGGAVVGNAGAFGGEIGPSVREVVLMRPDGTLRRHVTSELDFGYRRSFVRPDEVVLEVELEFEDAEHDAVRAKTAEVNAKRSSSQPKGGHSSGCVFKNPPGDAAGRLIDSCGLKGMQHGGATISEQHANFIVNDGTASFDDIVSLIDEVRERVREQTGVTLEVEPRIWSATAEPPRRQEVES